MRPGIRSTPILSSPTQASTFLFATMRFPAYCLTLFLATAHHQAVGRALAGCQGVFNCATGISTENGRGSGQDCNAFAPCSSGTCKNTEGWSLCIVPIFGKCKCV